MIEEIGDNLFKDLRESLGTYQEHVKEFDDLLPCISNLHNAKERIYKKSFARRGIVGVFMNLARKFDVIEGQLQNVPQVVSVELVDALIDIAVYALKFVVIIARFYPDVYIDWRRKVYDKYVGEDSHESSKS